MKVSVVIPTMTLGLLEKCVASLVKYTDLERIEIIVVANGADPKMADYVVEQVGEGVPIRCLWFPDPLGAVPALNIGIMDSKEEYVLLLNDDCEILESPKNFWLDSLLEPFSDPEMAVTGPFRMIPMLGAAGTLSLSQEDANYGFIVFFMALLKRTIFDEMGLLDEKLKCGVDIDFCMKLKRKGYKIAQVPEEERLQYNDTGTHLCGSYPIWHQAEGTVHDHYGLEEWHKITKADAKILEDRYGTKKEKKVSIIIPTFGDNIECLKKCVDSVLAHTSPHVAEIVIVANGCTESVRKYVNDLLGPITILWFDEATGFPFAANEGVRASSGEFVVFLNHDTVILGDMWLPYLLAPFDDSRVGITGPVNGGNTDTGRNFVMFFCACIRRKVFDEIGLVDMVFSPGGFEDIDFSYRAENSGWKLQQVPGEDLGRDGQGFTGNFPIFHQENHGGWMNAELYERNRKVILERYGPSGEVAEKLATPREIYPPDWPSAQKRYELIMLQEFLKNEKIVKVLEIGTYRGGSTMLWAKMVAPHNGRVFACDLKFEWGAFEENGIVYNRQVYNDSPFDQFVTEIQGDSHDREFIGKVRREVGSVDLLFIDGDHSYAGVKQDFEAYFPLLKHGGHVVFHDILDSEWHRMMGCHVTPFWKEIKEKFPCWEFVDNNEYIGAPSRSMGLGVLRKSAPPVEKKPYTVLCSIPTKDRYDILPLCVMAVANQTKKPDKLIIYDDGEHKDLREHPIYRHLFITLDSVGIAWEVKFLDGKGQHHAHQMANNAGFDLVWRLDDDTIPEPDVLAKLLDRIQYDIGAVGGAVIMPGQEQEGGTNKIEDIYHLPNVQWKVGHGVVEVDHLYSSFLYRAGIVPYCTDLSPVAHREETIFSHELKMAGWKLIVDTSIRTWHYRQDSGGIRSHDQKFFYEHDEKIFTKKMGEWGYKLIPLGTGLGDHLAFKNIVPDLLKKYRHLVIGATFPEVFNGDARMTVIPFGAAAQWCDDNIYKWMIDRNWKGSIIEAYREMYK